MRVRVTRDLEGFRFNLHDKNGKRYHTSDPVYADSWEASTAGHNYLADGKKEQEDG